MNSKSKVLAHHSSLLNFLACPQRDNDSNLLPTSLQPYTKFLPVLDPEETKFVFKFEGLQQMYGLIHRYYNKYKSSPGKVVFEGLLQTDSEFMIWYGKAGSQEKKDLEFCCTYLYRVVDDREFYFDQSLSLIVKVKLKGLSTETAAGIHDKGIKGVDLLDDVIKSVNQIRQQLSLIEDEQKYSVIDTTTQMVDASSFSNLAGLKTIFPQIILKPTGVSALLAPSKVGKTRCAVGIGLNLAKRGYHVAYWDFENGSIELAARFYQTLVNEIFGFTLPLECFYAEKFVDIRMLEQHEDFSGLAEPISQYDPTRIYHSGNLCYRIHSWTETVIADGLEKDQWKIELQIMQANVDIPGTEDDWTITPLPDGKDYGCCKDLQEIIDNEFKQYLESLSGMFRICHVKNATIADVEAKVEDYLGDPLSGFYKLPDRRVGIYDWIGNLTGYGDVWKASRRTYAEVKALQAKYFIYSLVIDGVSNPELLTKPDFNPDNVKSKDNRQTKYDVANVNILAQTQEEKKTRCLTMTAGESRYGASGGHVKTYLQNDVNFCILNIISVEEHKEINPEYWESLKQSKKGKYKKTQQQIAESEPEFELDMSLLQSAT